MKILKKIRDWRTLQKQIRAGARELGGSRGFLRAMRKNWYMWVGIAWAIMVGEFWLLAVIAVCSVFGATCMDWTLEGYKKMLDGYGTMVDQQQTVIRGYQWPNEHESEKAARARLN